MFYEITARELAKYLGNTSFDLIGLNADSDRGYRTNGSNRYDCKVYDVHIKVKNIKIDTFLDAKGDITCIIHIPPTDFTIVTEELSKFYPNKDKLSFKGRTDPFDKVLKFEDVRPKCVEDFDAALAKVVATVQDYITSEIVNHNHKDTWKVVCDNTVAAYDVIFHNERQGVKWQRYTLLF